MDNTRKIILALGLVILVAEYTFVICDGIRWTKYHYNGNTGHKHTPNEKVVQTEVKEPITCGKLCHTEGSCNSFSYQPYTRKCIGCSTLHCGAEPSDSSVDSAITMFFSTTEESSGPAPAVRLTGGKHMKEGTLEVEYNRQWGTVCNESFGIEEAMVACNMLNYTTNNPKTYQSANFSQRSLPILLGNVSCSGSEKNLFECSHRAWGESSCNHGAEVGISCVPGILARLTGGNTNYRGTLKVHYNGQWGTVCLDGFGEKESEVACNMLNLTWAFAGVSSWTTYGAFKESLPLRMMDVSCFGSEKTLFECSHRAWGEDSSCWRPVGLACAPYLHIRLMEGSLPKTGRVEVSLDGVLWGTVCRDKTAPFMYYNEAAEVMCRMLGYKEGGYVTYGKPGTLPILMYIGTDACAGPEETILTCSGLTPDVGKCTHDEDVSVECY